MAETGQIGDYIRRTFSKLTNDQGRVIDIELAYPTLFKLLSGGVHEFDQQKYDFIGEAACQFAINTIIAKQYPRYDNRILSTLVKKFRDLTRLHKTLDQEIHLKDHVLSPYFSQTMNSILGILYSFYGIKIVEKLVETAVLHIINIELGLVQTKKKQLENQNSTNDNPIYALNQLIYSNNGAIDTTSQEASNFTWQVKITAKINSTSVLFSHSRIGKSKQKAKTEVAKDILNFLTQRPELYEQLKQPSDGTANVHALPILEADYFHLNPATPITNDELKQQGRIQQQEPLNTTDWVGNDPNNIHISCTEDEDAIQLMSNLLLNNGSIDVEMSEESPTKKRQRQSIFSPYGDSVSNNSKDENRAPPMPIPTSAAPPNQNPNVKIEDSASDILAALHQPPPATQAEPVVTYKKIEEEFDPFNQPAPTPVYNEKVVAFFKKIFTTHRHLLIQTLNMPGQSKSVFLSLVHQHKDVIYADVKSQQGGSSHNPFFNAIVTLKSKLKPQLFLKTEGMAKRKKDAEQMAFTKLIELLK